MNTLKETKTNKYKLILKQLVALHEDESDHIAILANASALLYQYLNEVNWVGFYIWKDDELVLGPFQGLPACTRIAYGKGVCGTAFKERKTLRVADVNQYPGHIACDAASRSEIVIRVVIKDQPYGVLDIDSPQIDRFDEVDQHYLEEYARIMSQYLFSNLDN